MLSKSGINHLNILKISEKLLMQFSELYNDFVKEMRIEIIVDQLKVLFFTFFKIVLNKLQNSYHMSEISTKEDSYIAHWLNRHANLFDGFGTERSCVQAACDSEQWTNKDIPVGIRHACADFFSSTSLITKRDYNYTRFENPDAQDIPPAYEKFKSTPDENLQYSLSDQLKHSDPISAIVPPKKLQDLMDPRSPLIKIQEPNMEYITLELDKVSSPVGIIEPIIISAFVFDSVAGRAVTEQWKVGSNGLLTDALLKNPAFKSYVDGPKTASFAIKRPKTSVVETESLTNGLYFIILLNRAMMPKAGAKVNEFYTSPKDANKKKAEVVIKEMNTDGTVVTFAYAAMQIQDILKNTDDRVLVFDQIVETDRVDDEFLQHKLTKVRKHPVYYPIVIAMNLKFGLHGTPMEYFYPVNPYFSLKFENKMFMKLKSLVFSMKNAMKAKNVVVKILFVERGNNLPVFRNRQTEYITNVQHHVTQCLFQEDVVMFLPDYITTTMNIVFQFYNVDGKKKNFMKIFGEASFPVTADGLIRTNGEYKIPVFIDQNRGDLKNILTIELVSHSTINSPSQAVTELLKSNYSEQSIPPYQQIIPFLPPVLDLVIQNICQSNQEAFKMLISIVDIFPINDHDTRYPPFAQMYDKQIIQPCDHLRFYVNYCALRKVDPSLFYSSFLYNWYLLTKEPSIVNDAARKDLRSCPFLIDLLLKCLVTDKKRICRDEFTELILNLQKSILDCATQDPAINSVGNRINHFLALLYKDLFEFADKGVILNLVRNHVSLFSLRLSELHRILFVDFLSCLFSTKAFIYCCIPIKENNPYSSVFATHFIPKIEEGLATADFTNRVFSIIFKLLTYFSSEELQIISPAIEKTIILIGRHYPILREYESVNNYIFLFIVALYCIQYYDYDSISQEFADCCRFILEISNAEIDTEPALLGLVGESDSLGPKNSTFIQTIQQSQPDIPTISTKETWQHLAFVAQLTCLSITIVNHSIYTFSYLLCTLYKIRVSDAIYEFLTRSAELFLDDEIENIFLSKHSRVSRLFAYVLKNLTDHNWWVIDRLFANEFNSYGTNNRCKAFSRYALWKYKMNKEKLAHLEKSSFFSTAKEYYDLVYYIDSFDQNDDNNYELIAEGLLKLADFFLPSPDSRIHILMDISKLHFKYNFNYEGIVAQVDTMALICESLYQIDNIPSIFAHKNHPALDFVELCPYALHEVFPDELMNDLPYIPGFATTYYFSECGILYLYNNCMNQCKKFELNEFMAKCHQLFRPLLEYRHLWSALGNSFKINSVLIDVNGENNLKELGSYYRIEYQTGETYITRETQFPNLWQVSEKMRNKAKKLSGGKQVVVINDGEDLSKTKKDPMMFYVHVKAVEPYFGNEDKSLRATTFDMNRNISSFYFDLPYSMDGKNSIEHLWLHRTVLTVPDLMPNIVSRIQVPPENIQNIKFSPIEYSIQSLTQQVEKISEFTNKGDFKSLQPLIQGSLLTQVNEGPKKMAEVFLNSTKEDPKLQMQLRELFRKFLDTNETAVSKHGQFVKNNPAFSSLQEELENGMKRLSSAIQPYLK
ncbi:hypothetical protein TRFO_06850 [Tritrichomonas foetus]|uniref:DOCKER domain-containing protein n=1 Tax=Tritrichomonas foetus TaxID=1144522 RepID=A0A1J4JXI0_9EUKA|nr:hypothetical protein TRFO_06850 [Tritrichomonas foetus]|eukprot:OHT03168.1 hypothetical protein TRFO_06850 [Tritrichomonas foetus]